LHGGNERAIKRAGLVKKFHLAPTSTLHQIAGDITSSYYMLVGASGFNRLVPRDGRDQIADDVDAARDALARGQNIPPPQQLRADASAPERAVHQALASLADAKAQTAISSPKVPFFVPDALTNPAYQRYALKTTFAAMVCYIIYTSLNWQGIHTAMITCYVASLGTAGDTLHKLILRISGCFVGAAIGIGTIVFAVPHVDSVGGLMILIFVGTLPAAWLATGSERMSYAGIQIGLVYYLSILNGFGPSLDMEIARDRFIGILVGNIAVYLVATFIWPVRLDQALRRDVARALTNLSKLAGTLRANQAEAVAFIIEVERALGRLDEAMYRLPLERGWTRTEDGTIKRFQIIAAEIERLGTEIFFSDQDLSAVAPHLDFLSALAARNIRQANNDDIPPNEWEAQYSSTLTLSLRQLETVLGDWR